MKKDSIVDYLGYLTLKLLGPLIRALPLNFSLFLGEVLGELMYYFDFKHKAIAYSNIKAVLGAKLSPWQLSDLTRKFFHNFGQNLVEIFLIPLVNKEYINKYISFEGLNYITEGFRSKKGVIILGVHAGGWELTNIICASLGFPFSLFVRDQRHPRLDRLLNLYRLQKGCKVISRKNYLRQLIQVLKDNESIGMSADQGGKRGVPVKFFDKDASMSTGAIKLALKYDAALILGFYTRLSGPYIKIIIEPPFKLRKTGNLKQDIHDNLQEVVRIFERLILKYPEEYLWTYKIWKYTKEKNILILSDGKTGHLRQAGAIAKIASETLKDKDIATHIDTIEVKFKNKFSSLALTLSSCLAGKYHCQGCLWCLRTFLEEDAYRNLISIKPDMVISCGSSIAPVNFVLSRENLAKSIVIMRPSILSVKRFDLVVMPWHDRPPKRKNVVVTDGALNLINEDYLKEQSRELLRQSAMSINVHQCPSICIGLLIGGDTKNFRLKEDTILEVINQIKSITKKVKAEVLVTTSRRTHRKVEELVKKEFKNYPSCKLLIIANEKNPPFTIGGILGLSQIIVSSPESISMICEAVSSKKYVLVFQSEGLSKKHKQFLEHFNQNKYIYLTEPKELSKTIIEIWEKRPLVNELKDDIVVKEAIKRIL